MKIVDNTEEIKVLEKEYDTAWGKDVGKKMRKTILTEREKELISQIACDLESGNHLIRPRSEEYWAFSNEFWEASNTKEPTEKQKQILEYYYQSTDYFYWNNLPDEEKMF